METKHVYITAQQAADIKKKLEAHIDDLLADIRLQVVDHLADIINSYKLDSNDENEILHPVHPSTP